MHTPHVTLDLDQETVPIRLWPPGFSLLLAAFGYCGGSTTLGCLWLPRVSWLIAVPFATILCRRLGTGKYSGPLVALTMTSDGLLNTTCYGLSDAPFFLLVLWSFLCFHRWTMHPERTRWLFWAGLLAGISYGVRNVGLPLVAIVPAALWWNAWKNGEGHRRGMTCTLPWLYGAMPFVILLKLRNLLVFGTHEPYLMGPSQIGLIGNFGWAGIALWEEFHIWPFLKEIFIVSRIRMLLSTACPLLIGVGIAIKGWGSPQISRRDRLFGVVIFGYVVLGWTMVLAARTLYEMGQPIRSRNAALYTMYACGLLIVGIRNHRIFKRVLVDRLLIACLCVLFLMRVEGLADLRTTPIQETFILHEDPIALNALRSIDKRDLLITDTPEIKILAEHPVRIIEPVGPKNAESFSEQFDVILNAADGREVYFVAVGSRSTPALDARDDLERHGIRLTPCFQNELLRIVRLDRLPPVNP
ncbi:MAG: hypothetical protein QM811_22915 [Pirellulales bacterium]